ncbi:hypothetical protein B0H66DRAFT_542286 [Apodospora peruviana]|uniref:Uncharacterized protein n=1 Tax=Apodospora peruviana TaxID=516989 RepID=A0AAE0ISR3_9PEZI|nr:hypothetical protein B0H66DRAFT_542286 [Apodospora peruviana]
MFSRTIMPSLPLKVQVGIRDHWTKEDSEVQTTLKSLEELLGHNVVVEPEWPLLVTELDTYYPDKGSLVAAVAYSVQAWAKAMMELLDDSAHEEWIETVLEKTGAVGRLRLYIEVAASSSETDGATSWSESRSGFVITLPKKQIYHTAELFPVFRGDLLTCFGVEKLPQLPIRSAASAADDWDEVNMAPTPQSAAASLLRGADAGGPNTRVVEFLPSVPSLPRPDELFLRPPFHLHMMASNREIEIQCSHSPSLQLLANYLKRWCRVNHHDTRNPPAIQVTLHQSAFGLGQMFDRLVLNTHDTRYTNQFQVTAPMVIALIEGVLGYELVSAHGTWSFRRDTAFKTL